MRRYLAAIVFIMFAAPLCGQVKLVRLIWPPDSFGSIRYYPLHGPVLQWGNWRVYNEASIPKEQNYDVYYDYGYRHLGFSCRGGMTDTGWVVKSYREYYLNGRLASEREFNLPDGSSRHVSYDYWGDTASFEIMRGYYRVESRYYRIDDWNPNVRYLSSRSYRDPDSWQMVTLHFDREGDTTYYDSTSITGQRFISYYQDKRLYGTSQHDTSGWQETKYIKFPPEEIYELNLSPKNISRFDSLRYYKNVKRLRLELRRWDTTGNAVFISRLNELSVLGSLEEIKLVGTFEVIPAFVFQCERLNALEIHGTRLKEIPVAIRSLTALRSLAFSSNDSLEYSSSIRNLIPLRNLRLLSLPLENGAGLPKAIARLKNLRHLSLGSYELCTRDSSPDLDMKLIYKLKNLRTLEVCSGQYFQIDLFEFTKRLPNCMVWSYETCFDRFSYVTLYNGRRKFISEVQVGDVLMGYDTENRKFIPTTVTVLHTHHKPMEGGLEIRYSTAQEGVSKPGSITTTAIHPFLINGEWTLAGALKPGDLLQTCTDGKIASVIVTEVNWCAAVSAEVYNFTTSNHTFFVNGVLVHNK